MEIKSPIKTRKGLAFAGCSFTWGQGLYYYSNLPTVKLPNNQNKYDKDLITYAQYKFLESVRFPRIVANYFDTFELVRIHNGGANHTTMEEWRNFNDFNPMPWYNVFNNRAPEYSTSEISTFVCQLTQWTRSMVTIEYGGRKYGPWQYMDMFEHEIFFKWLDINKLSLDQYIDITIKKEVLKIKSFLQEIENKGIKVGILIWPADLVDAVKTDSWLNDRFIELSYERKIYSNIQQLIEENPNMYISHDYDFFIDPPKDNHPSLKCHQVIANNIINFLKRKEYII
jgi:hypothetical protein